MTFRLIMFSQFTFFSIAKLLLNHMLRDKGQKMKFKCFELCGKECDDIIGV